MIEIVSYGAEVTPEAESLITKAISSALDFENRSGDVTVLLTTEEEIKNLNNNFRYVNAVTDVLSFPAWEGENSVSIPDGYLGDIAICVKRAMEQANDFGHSIEREMAFLAVHGALHIMGYDHMKPEDEKVMRSKQTKILERMGLGIMKDITAVEKEKMIDMAMEAMEHAYVPYSGFKVGACLRTDDGKYYQGCNIENAAYTPTNCAERTAVFKAVYDGIRSFSALAVACSGEYPAFPCGVCRQVLSEFCDPEMPVFCVNKDRYVETLTLGELLPKSFGRKDLKK